MYSSDRVVERYTQRSKDASLTAKEREAAELLLRCEELLDKEKDQEAFDLGKTAVTLCKEIKDQVGVADAVRIQAHVLIYQEQRKEASQLVKETLASMEELADESGQGKMLLSMAEINSERRGDAKREEGQEQATEALKLFRKLGDKKMEVNTLLTLCSIHMHRSRDRFDGALLAVDCASQALKISRSLGDRRGEAASLHAYAVSSIQAALLSPNCCMNTLHFDPTFEDGMDAGREALRIWRELGAKEEAYELHCLARWQLAAGQPEKALQDAEMSSLIQCNGQTTDLLATRIKALLANQQVDEALRLAEASLKDAKNLGNEMAKLVALDLLVDAYSQNGQLKEAHESAEEALEVLRDTDDTRNELRMQGVIAQLQLSRQEYAAALEAADEMLRIAEELEDSREQARARLMMAEVLKNKGDIAGALKETKAQQRLFRAAQDVKGEALAVLQEADARYQQGEFEDALAIAMKACEIYKGGGDKTGEAAALGIIAEIHQILNDAEAVLKASARQRSLLKSIGDKRGEAAAALRTCHSRLYVLSNSGHARDSQEYQDVWSRAFKEAKDGMMLAYANGDDFVYAQSFYVLAQVYVAVNDKGVEALQVASQCTEMYKELGDTRGEAQAFVTVAHANHLLSKADDAAEALTKAMTLFREIGDEHGQTIVMQAMHQFIGVPQQMNMNWQQQQQQWGQYDAPAQVQQAAPKSTDKAAPQAPTPAGPIKLDPEAIANTIRDAVSAITMMDVEADEPLMQAGLTSNTTVILRNELAQQFPGKQMPFTLVFDHPSISAIADFLAD